MERIELPGTLNAHEPLGAFILAAAKQAGLATKRAYGLRLAMDEVATNIITHGYEEQGRSGGLVVEAEISEQHLTMTIEDTAPPFDPRTLLGPAAEDLKRPLEEREVGGLGVFLAFKSIDRFDYVHTGTANRNIFIMNRGQAGAAGSP